MATKLGTLKTGMHWDMIESIAREIGIVFVPPLFHARVLARIARNLTPAAFRNVGTFINRIGPLLSPVKVDHRFIGAWSMDCLHMLADACLLLGDVPTTLVASEDGLDEVSSMADSRLIHLTAEGRCENTIEPRSLGIHAASIESLCGHEPPLAAQCCERILSGKGSTAQTEIVALNAAVVLTSAGMHPDLPASFQTTMRILRDGQALQKLRELREALHDV